ncbi:hypothetical protein IWW34DRAFT_215572 [Fusarium oxysporum f. sp. albedinis]|nr:hypothetical protein IWW34DRAFT_215572 [Fusarium oxysporum f. sp. albedinis]KAJ0129116.1 Uncharacterized protein HZ326_27787 [Fusarium oxysporum f. sp. albedinis]KAJ0131854.1 Uncharacterized protein HZ326_25053 [Fusarium oxysporum f. sp. albedinis]KAK2470383.1 hypothetical protein H9L39_18000 [Fusarium oxysporum f. sp. albedinis]
MCYFDQVVWACGNWRWGKFREQCNKEHRIGETCGLKLVYERQDEAKNCKVCDQVTKKENRIRRTTERMARLREWKHLASLERCEEEVASLKGEILRLREQHSTNMSGGAALRLESGNPFELRTSIGGPLSCTSIPIGLTERQDDLTSKMLFEIYAARRQTRPKDNNNHLLRLSKTSAGVKKHRKTLA